MIAVVVAAALCGVAAALAVPPRGRGLARGPTDARVTSGPAGAPGQGPEPTQDDLLRRLRVLVALLAGTAAPVLLGGPLGLAGGAVTAALVHRMLLRREPAGERRRREQVTRQLPHAVDLLAVVLAAGAAPSTALATVAAAVEGPVARELEAARHALALGRDPARVWREVARRPGLAALGRSMARAVETGAPVSDALHRLAEDLQAAARAEAESRARTVGVRAAAPLGLCLLPAFVLIGVVPLVAATVGSLLSR